MPVGGFATLGVIDDLQQKVNSCGWNQPTMIQIAAIPKALTGKDVVGIAETGSGKTAAFLIPILQLWIKSGRPKGAALVLAPTRELAQQIALEAERLGSASDCRSDPDSLRVICLIGGEDMVQQTLQLAWNRHHMIVATPGRLMDHIRQSDSFASQQLSKLQYLVLDEADRMLSLDFADDIDTLLQFFQTPTRMDGKRGRKRRRRKKSVLLDPDQTAVPCISGGRQVLAEKARFPHPQTQLYSATMTKDLAKLRRAALSPDAVVVTSKPEPSALSGPDGKVSQATADDGKSQLIASRSIGFPVGLRHYYIPLCLTDKLVALDWLLEQGDRLSTMLQLPGTEPPSTGISPPAAGATNSGLPSVGATVQRIIVFCKRCQETRLLTAFLRERGHKAIGLTGRMKQPERKEALREFLFGRVSILVATDVASRGLDIPNVALVVNYSVPLTEKTYRHRVGRAARAGQAGLAVTLVTHDTGSDFIELETRLSPHLTSSSSSSSSNSPKKGKEVIPRWPVPMPSKDAMLVRCRQVDEARSRASKAIRAEDLARRRMLEPDSGSESLTDQSVNLSSDEDEKNESTVFMGRKDYPAEASDDSEATVSSTNSIGRQQSADRQLITSGLAGICAARAQLRKMSREKSSRRRQRAEADDASRSAAAEGWGLQFTLDSIESVMASGNMEEMEEAAEEKEEHLRFAEPVKTKYMKATKERKRHVRP